MKKKTTTAAVDEGYFPLIREFPLKTIRSETELDRATEVIHSLIDRGIESLTDGEQAYLDVLSNLTEKYEAEHYPIEDVHGAEMLAYLIENRGASQRAVAAAIGVSESTISDLLSGRRELTRNHMDNLSAYFHVSQAVFFPERR